MEVLRSTFLDDAKLCGVFDTYKGRDAIQGDLDRLERWAYVDLINFNKAKCKAGAIPNMNTGWGMNGVRAPLRRRTWGCW